MSLSMAFVTVLFLSLFFDLISNLSILLSFTYSTLVLHAASCDGDCDNGIWRDQLRLLALVSFIIEAPATFILYYLDKKKVLFLILYFGQNLVTDQLSSETRIAFL